MNFSTNQKLTIIGVTDFTACTYRREIKITRVQDGRPVYVVKGKRKEYYFEIKPDLLVFEGWSLPLVIDSDTLQFAGNACYNFLVRSSVSELRHFIKTNNINPYFTGWDEITYDLEKLRGNPLPLFKP